ncbi:DEAD/DEAH box helicase family protein [Komagataeibacter medellinensis]|uniref:DEAD/DEAH box helicase family protein n=1 Tax=Komagataeibacter medellinensis TaxID=1177712 RepID=UPI00225E51D7|nr:DEAD/DEAH box helicase [Komagataeibacter medellinensis]
MEARAGTGSGKTVAFAAPIISTLAAQAADNSRVRCLVLSPTRELAGQIAGVLRGLARGTGLRVLQATGGTARVAQARTLADGVAIVVGTPGRVSDLVHGGELGLSAIGSFVLDEADRMLDPALPKKCWPLLQSCHQSTRPCCSPPPYRPPWRNWLPACCTALSVSACRWKTRPRPASHNTPFSCPCGTSGGHAGLSATVRHATRDGVCPYPAGS